MASKKKKPRPETFQAQVRMGKELMTEVRAYQNLLCKETGLEATFSDAVRALVRQGLKAQR
jgi:hypothetical protein